MGEWSRALIGVLRPKERLTGSEWADKYRVIPPGTTPEPGEWRTSRVPYLREIMDAATDRRTETVVVMSSSQIGKSELVLNVMGYYMDREPSPILVLQPTLEAAESFSKERIEPSMAYSPGLKDKVEQAVGEGRTTSRKKLATIRMKHFAGGYLAMVGANSPAGLASRPIRILLADEVDRYGSTKEGDPLKLAIQRTTNFHNRKIVIVSTPTVKGASMVEEWFGRSDQRYYYVTCPECGNEHVWDWDLVTWDKDEDGKGLPETARICCPGCGRVERSQWKPDMSLIGRGRWKASEPGNGRIKGYALCSLYSPWVSLSALVEEYLSVVRAPDRSGLQEFLNLKLGKPYDTEYYTDSALTAITRREDYGPVDCPEGVLLLTCGVDVQHDRLELMVMGWGVGQECWGVQYARIYGAPSDPATWHDLDTYLQHEFSHAGGGKLRIACTCIDSGDGTTTELVYGYTHQRERARVYATKGIGGFNRPLVSPPSRNNRYKAKLFALGVDSAKSLLFRRLKVDFPGPGYVHFASAPEAGFDEVFFDGLYSERIEKYKQGGSNKIRWIKTRERNEPLDCCVYALAACEILAPNFSILAATLQKEPTKRQKTRRKGTISSGIAL